MEGTVLVMRWVRGGGGFVGDLLEGRKKAETRLIRGRGVGVREWGTSVHFPNCQGRYMWLPLSHPVFFTSGCSHVTIPLSIAHGTFGNTARV